MSQLSQDDKWAMANALKYGVPAPSPLAYPGCNPSHTTISLAAIDFSQEAMTPEIYETFLEYKRITNHIHEAQQNLGSLHKDLHDCGDTLYTMITCSNMPSEGVVKLNGDYFKYEISDDDNQPPLTFEPTDVYEFVDDITTKQETAA